MDSAFWNKHKNFLFDEVIGLLLYFWHEKNLNPLPSCNISFFGPLIYFYRK